MLSLFQFRHLRSYLANDTEPSAGSKLLLRRRAPIAAVGTKGNPGPDNPFIQVAEQVTPSVVNISTVTTGKAGKPSEQFRPFGNDPFFRDFFDRFFEGMPRRRQQTSLGSGVVIDKEG